MTKNCLEVPPPFVASMLTSNGLPHEYVCILVNL